jgi:hypothetical protein
MSTNYDNTDDNMICCSSCSTRLEDDGITEIQPRLGNFNLFQFLDKKGKVQNIHVLITER